MTSKSLSSGFIFSYLCVDKVPYLFALLFGLVTALAFPPYNFPLTAFFGPVGLLWLYYKNKQCHPYKLGCYFGISYFGMGLQWLYVPIYYYGQISLPISIMLTLLVVFLCANSFAVMLKLFHVCRHKDAQRNAFLFAGLWVFQEWLRATVFSGFPWLFIGYTQLSMPLHYWAPVIGIYGVSFLCIYISMQFYTVLFTKYKIFPVVILSLIGLFTFAVAKITWTEALPDPIKISLVQANGLNDNNLPMFRLKQDSPPYPHLFIWPETTTFLKQDEKQSFLTYFKSSQHNTAVDMIIGVLESDHNDYYNTIITTGEVFGKYTKKHLVPLGENIPIGKSLIQTIMAATNIRMDIISPGQIDQALLRYHNLNILPFICYDVVYPNYVDKHTGNANLAIVMANNIWYQGSNMYVQLEQMIQFRALELQKPILVSSRYGTTSIIQHNSQVTARLPLGKSDILTNLIYPRSGQSMYMLLGSNGILLLIVMFYLLINLTWLAINNIGYKSVFYIKF